jgi:hypothetical protein
VALVTIGVARIDGVGFVEITYDDSLAVGDDLTACDLVSARVFVEPARTAKYSIRRGVSSVWREGSVTGPFDQTFNAGGPVQTVSDLLGWTFGGDE